VWDRAPDVSDPLVRFFLGKQGVPSLFRRWWRALRSADAFVHVGRPLDLHALKERVGSQRLAGVLQRVLKRALRDERRLVHGPRLLPHRTMKQLVLDNPPMRELALSEATAQGKDPVRVRREMSRHYDRIAANFSWTVIQLLHVLLRPLWTRVFSGVDARPEDIERIRAALRDGSLVLVPCHKSHFDYVLMSWVMYDHDLIVPHVVAGMNLAVWPVSILLRGAGGFFVRRTFGDDKLFPAVFARYLRELVLQEYPVEFFIEGGRTRSGKLMPPKLGVLSMVLDAATVRSHGREVTLLPIALAYEQVAEEGTYARELGGEQKQPESMRDLLKARSVLRRRFGRVYLRVGEPVRCGQLVDDPPDWSTLPASERKQRLTALGQRIVHRIGKSMVLLPTSLLSVALLAIPRRAVRHSELLARVHRFDALFRHKQVLRAASLDRFEQAIAQALDRFVRDRRIEALEAEGERLWSIHPDQRIFLDFYKNQILHVLGPAGLAACALRPEEDPATLEQLAPRFEALCQLMRREFVWDPDQSPRALLQEGLDDLVIHGAVQAEDGLYRVVDTGRIGEIYGLLRPLLEGYMFVLTSAGPPQAPKDIPASIQERT
jgi:glycerol-3-phosphate O-acyltransferase